MLKHSLNEERYRIRPSHITKLNPSPIKMKVAALFLALIGSAVAFVPTARPLRKAVQMSAESVSSPENPSLFLTLEVGTRNIQVEFGVRQK